MGTHPIFESDFDCLTEAGLMRMAEFESWRNFCLNRNVFKSHEERILKENELILNSDEVNEEYKMLQDQCDHIDNKSFYFYIKRRVNAAVRTKVSTNVSNLESENSSLKKDKLQLEITWT